MHMGGCQYHGPLLGNTRGRIILRTQKTIILTTTHMPYGYMEPSGKSCLLISLGFPYAQDPNEEYLAPLQLPKRRDAFVLNIYTQGL